MKTLGQIRVLIIGAILGISYSGTGNACALEFQEGDTATTVMIDGTINPAEWSDASSINSTDPCLDNLIDLSAHSSPEVYNPVNNVNRSVTIYSKRDSANFYIALNVQDQTLPLTMGEQVVVYLDPNNSRSTSPGGYAGDPDPGAGHLPEDYDYRYAGTFMRGGADVYTEEWQRGNGTTWVNTTKPAGVTALASNLAGNAGYQVEIKIPFAAVGYTLASGDLGMAIAVVNDLNATSGSFPVLSAIAYPWDDTHLPVNIDSDPIDATTAGSNWNNPSHWGEAYTRGAGDTFYFSQQPESWLSKDLVSAFCTATSFQQVIDAGGRTASNPYWYLYSPTNTCNPVRVWAKLRRDGALVGAQQRRVLFLWGEPGISVRDWYYLGMTDPVTLDSASPNVTDEAGPAKFEITQALDWSHVSSGLSGHPCLRAIALPVTLHPDDQAAFDSYEADPAHRHPVDLAALSSRYVVTENRQRAQMNILVVGSVSCPDSGSCPPPPPAPGDGGASLSNFMVASNDLSGIQLAQVTGEGGLTHGTYPPDGHNPDVRNAIFDLTGYGVAPTTSTKKYSYVETLGGLQEVVSLDYLRKNKNIRVPINFTNPDDLARKVFVTVRQTTAPGDTNAALDIDVPRGVVQPGEKLVLNTTLKDVPPGTNGNGGCGCFDFSCYFRKIFN